MTRGQARPPANRTSGRGDDGAVSPESARDALRRIVSSDEFEASDRARDFLRFVVAETLGGRSDRIKAFTIATEVFGRDTDFDAQNDPIVRIEAGRLRRALERYYIMAGAADPVRIDIPKGGYVPIFSRRADPDCTAAPVAAAPEAAGRPVTHSSAPDRPLLVRAAIGAVTIAAVALGVFYWFTGPQPVSGALKPLDAVAPPGPTIHVSPFSRLVTSKDMTRFADGLAEELTAQIGQFRELTILARAGGADYVLDGSVRGNATQVRVTARLLESGTSRVLWSDIYERDLGGEGMLAIEEDIAATIATAIAQPGGVIFRPVANGAGARRPERDAYDCTLAFYAYRSATTEDRHAEVRQCLRAAVDRHPDFATAWSLLAYMYIDEYRYAFNREGPGENALASAIRAARHAVRLDPANARASQALMTALFYDMRVEEALAVGENAVARNPNDTELLGEFGVRLGQAGFWDRGDEYLNRAVDLNPSLATMYTIALAQSAYMRGESERAVHYIRVAEMRQYPFFYAMAALIYADAGLLSEAAEARQRFLSAWPHFFDDFETELARRYADPGDRAKIRADARKAGFPVDGRAPASRAASN